MIQFYHSSYSPLAFLAAATRLCLNILSTAVLIGKADDDSFAAAGHMTEGQRPHMAGNDALFLFGDMEHLFCIDAGAARVGEAVHLEQAADAMEGTLFVPVIQIKIMKKSSC